MITFFIGLFLGLINGIFIMILSTVNKYSDFIEAIKQAGYKKDYTYAKKVIKDYNL